MFGHLDLHHLNEIVFICCKNRACCKEWKSEDLRQYLHHFDFRLPVPSYEVTHKGHHDTFLQRSVRQTSIYDEDHHTLKYSDDGQPTATSANLDSCKFFPAFRLSQKQKKIVTCQCSIVSKLHQRNRKLKRPKQNNQSKLRRTLQKMLHERELLIRRKKNNPIVKDQFTI